MVSDYDVVLKNKQTNLHVSSSWSFSFSVRNWKFPGTLTLVDCVIRSEAFCSVVSYKLKPLVSSEPLAGRARSYRTVQACGSLTS